MNYCNKCADEEGYLQGWKVIEVGHCQMCGDRVTPKEPLRGSRKHLLKKIDKDNYVDAINNWIQKKDRDVKLLMMKDHYLRDLHNGDIVKYGFANNIVIIVEKFGRYQIMFSFYSELM